MIKKTCKIRKKLDDSFVCCKCADWLCYYDEHSHVVRMCNTNDFDDFMPF